MAITTLSMVLTVFILNLHHVTDRPVPLWMKRLVLVYFAKILGFCGPNSEAEKNLRCGGSSVEGGQGHYNRHYRRASVRVCNDGENKTTVLEIHSNLANGEASNSEPLTRGGDHSLDSSSHEERCAAYAKDWKRVAEVFDRLFFWLFLLAILISTLVLFHPLTDAYLKRLTQGS